MPETRHKAEIYVNYTQAQTRQNLSSGEEIRTVFGKIKKWFSDMGTAAFKNVPTSGNAGNSEVVLGNDTRLFNARTPTAHNQASNTINAMTDYAKVSTANAITTTDTLNQAIGKLEKGLDNKVNTSQLNTSETSDTTPYLYKSSEHDAVYDELVGGSVAWNQLVANSGSSLSVTITSGHKYILKKNGTLSVGASSGSAITGLTGGTDWITDLTLMFGSTIADYAYSLEQSTAGSGIAWLKSYGFFTKDYYAYNAGGLVSTNVSGKKVVGKNLFEITANSETIKGVTFIVDKEAGTVTVNGTSTGQINFLLCNFKLTDILNDNVAYTLTGCPAGGDYANTYSLYVARIAGGTVWRDIGNGETYTVTSGEVLSQLYLLIRSGATVKNLVFKPMIRRADVTDSTFEPYTSISYPIQSTDLRGLYKLSGNKLYTDGDIYSADGTVTRKYGYRDYQSGDESLANAITDGTHTIYKLSAPTTVTASPYTSPQMVYRNGTEEYLDTRDVPMPVGGNRKYVDIPEWMVNEYFDDVRAETSTVSDIIEKLRRIDTSNGSSSTVRTIYAPDDSNGIRTTVGNNRTEVQVACGQASNANGKVVFTDSKIYGGIGNPTSLNANHFMFNDDCGGDSIGKLSSGAPLTGSEFDLNYETINLNGSTINIDDNMSIGFETIDDYTVNTIKSPYIAISTDGISLSPKTTNQSDLLISRLPSGSGSELVINSNGVVYKSSSSRDIKHDIQYVEDTDSYHDALMQIKPATYVYNNDKTETTKLGMIAEDIADVMPIAALTGEDGKVENYDTRAVIAMLIMEVQRLNAEIKRLRGDNNAG